MRLYSLVEKIKTMIKRYVGIVISATIVLTTLLQCAPPEMQTACEQLDEIDLQMLNMIKQIKSEYEHDQKFLAAFNDAQLYWTQYRNRQVKAIFPLSPNKYEYNVGECKCEVYRDLTKLRVKELQKWLDGVPENTTCKGSYKVK